MSKEKNIIESEQVTFEIKSNEFIVVQNFGKKRKGDKITENRKHVSEPLVASGFIKPIK